MRLRRVVSGALGRAGAAYLTHSLLVAANAIIVMCVLAGTAVFVRQTALSQLGSRRVAPG